jgi:hypothetical protein
MIPAMFNLEIYDIIDASSDYNIHISLYFSFKFSFFYFMLVAQ